MNKTKNINNLIKMLRADSYTVAQIRKQFEKLYKISVSRETVYRYVRTLSALGFEVQKDEGKYHLLAEQGETFGIKDLFVSKSSPGCGNIITLINRGLAYGLPARLDYLSPRYDEVLTLQVKLIDLVRIKNKVYLIAKDLVDEVVKELRVDRIKTLVLGHSVTRKGMGELEIVFKVKSDLVKHFECPFQIREQTVLENGEEQYRVSVHSYFRAKKMLFEYMDQVVVLGPEEFVRDYLETVRNIVSNYENRGGEHNG